MGLHMIRKFLFLLVNTFHFLNLLNAFFPENLFFKNELTGGNNDPIFSFQIFHHLFVMKLFFQTFVRNIYTNDTNLLVNISNDGWFGNVSGPRQHFVHAQFRSIELGIPMVRSSNKGISGLISPNWRNQNVTVSIKLPT